MKKFEVDGKINFVDENNVFVGYDMNQDCCEHDAVPSTDCDTCDRDDCADCESRQNRADREADRAEAAYERIRDERMEASREQD